jgi:hypothetical protein
MLPSSRGTAKGLGKLEKGVSFLWTREGGNERRKLLISSFMKVCEET